MDKRKNFSTSFRFTEEIKALIKSAAHKREMSATDLVVALVREEAERQNGTKRGKERK